MKEILQNEISKTKSLMSKIIKAQNEWDTFSKHNTFNKAFWKIDKKIVSLWKEVQKLRFVVYPIREIDELQGYIEHLESQLTPTK